MSFEVIFQNRIAKVIKLRGFIMVESLEISPFRLFRKILD